MNQPQATVLCVNPACEEYTKVKEVPYQHLGQKVYLAGTLYCDCGEVLYQLLPGQVETARTKLRTDLTKEQVLELLSIR